MRKIRAGTAPAQLTMAMAPMARPTVAPTPAVYNQVGHPQIIDFAAGTAVAESTVEMQNDGNTELAITRIDQVAQATQPGTTMTEREVLKALQSRISSQVGLENYAWLMNGGQ